MARMLPWPIAARIRADADPGVGFSARAPGPPRGRRHPPRLITRIDTVFGRIAVGGET